MLTGCGGDSNPMPGPEAKSFTKVTLNIRCPDPAFASVLVPAAKSWGERTGATITVRTERMTPGDDTDIGILAASEFGTWADRNELVRVPAALRTDPAFQLTSVLPVYREQLNEWGGQAQAVPLAGDGFVIVYRADRLADATFIKTFQETHGRKPGIPATWEEFGELAAAFASRDGKPSLAPQTGAEVADLFFRVAACFDRSATSDATEGALLSFQFDIATGNPRLGAPGFVAAANWIASLAEKKCFPPVAAAADPVAALIEGRATLAVLPLAQLARLPRENGAVPARFGLAALPGTRRFVDLDTGSLIPSASPNYIPYFTGGRLGVVRTRCANPEAAFDLLAELGGPTRSLEVLSSPELGAGPFRVTHLERDRLFIWYGYGFDAERTKALQDAMRQYVRLDVRSPVTGLRGPDQAALSAAAATELGKLAGGGVSADAAIQQLIAAWNEIDARVPKDDRVRWRKMAAGAN